MLKTKVESLIPILLTVGFLGLFLQIIFAFGYLRHWDGEIVIGYLVFIIFPIYHVLTFFLSIIFRSIYKVQSFALTAYISVMSVCVFVYALFLSINLSDLRF